MEKLFSVRKIDNLGRICLPAGYRKILDIKSNDLIDLFLSEKEIVIKKHNLSVDYEELIRTLLIMKNGMEFTDRFITKEEISTFKDMLNQYIDNLISK